MTRDQHKIRRKLRIPEHADKSVMPARPAGISGLDERAFIVGENAYRTVVNISLHSHSGA